MLTEHYLPFTDRIDAANVDRIVTYVNDGRQVLVLLDIESDVESWNTAFAQVTGIHLASTRVTSGTRLSEVRLDHAIFTPLSGPQFNDFSAIRYDEHVAATVSENNNSQILARYEDGEPAVIETTVGRGSIILWTGGIDPPNTNLARSPRFIPLINETIAYLINSDPEPASYLIGQRLPTSQPIQFTTRTGPRGDIAELTEPGWISWEAESRIHTAAINADRAESDLTRIPITEFQLRLTSTEPLVNARANATVIPGEQAPRIEHGFIIILLIVTGLVFENLYAARLGSTQ